MYIHMYMLFIHVVCWYVLKYIGMCKLIVGKDNSKMWVSPAKISASAQSLTDKSATSPSYLDGSKYCNQN